MKRINCWVLVSGFVVAMAGCSSAMIGERLGADQVQLVTEAQAASCKSLGRITVSVLSSLGPITRGNDTVEENLLQMARNEAVDKGGDSVVKGNSNEFGKRGFEVFRCKR